MKPEFSQNPAYVRFENHLRDLHQLIANGEGDSLTADALREAMSAEYRMISTTEEERLNGLSEDLYTLSDPIGTPPSELPPNAAEIAAEFKRLREHNDWAGVLPILRLLAKFPSFTDTDTAFQRYQAYANLGHLETAYLFLRHASKLDPGNFGKRHILLEFSRKAGRRAEAMAEAERLLGDHLTPAPMIISAAHVKFDELRHIPKELAHAVVGEIAVPLERVMSEPESLKGNPRSFAILGYTTLGYCREELGDLAGALNSFGRALQLDPQSDALWVARGLVLARHNMDRAAEDFLKAVEMGTPLFQPYFLLAPYALGLRRWRDACYYAEQLMERTEDPKIQAEAQHWRAIALFELDSSWWEVEALFREASRLNPLNFRISQNFELCQQAIAWKTEQRSAIQWSCLGQTEPLGPVWPPLLSVA